MAWNSQTGYFGVPPGIRTVDLPNYTLSHIFGVKEFAD
jgi:hypothetical protein